MNKKYFPIFLLFAAALFFYWVKNNQRGKGRQPGNVTQVVPGTDHNAGTDLNRQATKIIYSKHALCRMDCRHIDESEVKEILGAGVVNVNKIESSAKGISYPLEGTTHDGQRVRIVFAPKEDGSTVVVTVIDLDTEFACDCR